MPKDAWTHEKAVALLRRETGTAFDGRCVEALARVIETAAAQPGDAGLVPRPSTRIASAS